MNVCIRWLYKRRVSLALLVCALLFTLGSPAARAEGLLSGRLASLRDSTQSLTEQWDATREERQQRLDDLRQKGQEAADQWDASREERQQRLDDLRQALEEQLGSDEAQTRSQERLDRLDAEGHATMRPHLPVIEPEYGRVMLEQMVLQSGARILYGTHVVDVVKEDSRIKSVVAYCKNGRIELDADVFVDATGDADLAMAAGCPIEVGNAEFMGLNQSVTMGFKLSYVNINRYREGAAAFFQSDEFDPESPKHST